jgi:hypothetical protein
MLCITSFYIKAYNMMVKLPFYHGLLVFTSLFTPHHFSTFWFEYIFSKIVSKNDNLSFIHSRIWLLWFPKWKYK